MPRGRGADWTGDLGTTVTVCSFPTHAYALHPQLRRGWGAACGPLFSADCLQPPAAPGQGAKRAGRLALTAPPRNGRGAISDLR